MRLANTLVVIAARIVEGTGHVDQTCVAPGP